MDAIAECCAGLDVHQASVVACVNKGPATKRPHKETRTFGTTRAALEELRDWLAAEGCTLVAMESTGIYWHPVYAVLAGHFDLIVGNAKHMKNVPGRKTDVKDCEWISDLARHGLIARSFVPPRPIRDLRDLTRYRRKLSQVQAAERNRLIRLLESATIKLSGLISDVFWRLRPGDAASPDRGRADARADGAARAPPDAAQDRGHGAGAEWHAHRAPPLSVASPVPADQGGGG